ncbi:cysteine desulfurase, partial [Francisella tularensis subsp. holarctica]|nr:cysteine desulfurase [Francisella tularensis subsp. holarctica]
MYDENKLRQDFPFLAQKINKKSVLFFDTGASAQNPQAVIECEAEAYAYNYANVHRGVYYI